MTLTDVCKAVGVSKTTVSNVINDKPGVSPEVRQKIQSLIKKMGFVPRPAARHLSLAKTDTIAVVFQDLTSGWLLTIYRGILEKASEARHHVITALSFRPGDEFELPTRVLGTASVDGLIWFDARATPDLIRKFKSQQSMPIVIIQRHLEDSDITTVSTENIQSAYKAVHHLLTLGHRKLMLITGQPENIDSQEKLIGARQALAEFNVTIPPERILNGHHVDDYAARALAAYLDAGNPLPEAIFSFNDNMALAVMRWLNQRGVRVPEDVAIVGFDGIDDARRAHLTTVEMPLRELGMMAFQLLIDLIHTQPEQRKDSHVFLGGTLQVRKTCGAHLRAP